VVDIKAHVAHHRRQVSGGEIQPGPHLGGHLSTQQRQSDAEPGNGGIPGHLTALGEIFTAVRGGGRLDGLDISEPHVAGAGGLSVGQQGDQAVEVQPGEPSAEGEPSDVSHKAPTVHPTALPPGHRARSHHNPITQPKLARRDRERIGAPDDARRVGQ